MALASDSGETIVACVNASGSISIVNDVAECGQNEKALEWNTQGIQGEPGPEGPAGADGSLSGLEYVMTIRNDLTFTENQRHLGVSVVCPEGKFAISAGVNPTTGWSVYLTITQQRLQWADGAPTTFTATMTDHSPEATFSHPVQIRTWAFCADVPEGGIPVSETVYP